MAVFTPVSLADLSAWLLQFPLGRAHAIKGISSGIENSNFFITTDAGDYVLTIFENLSFEQLPFYLHLMDHLAQRGILVPAPVANNAGQLVSLLHGKPAAIVSKLSGTSQMEPSPLHCGEVGTMLAKMHLAGQDYDLQQDNLRGLAWWTETAPKVRDFLSPEQLQLLSSELQHQQTYAASAPYQTLARGPIHADLFRNNVMFDGTRLTGFFDFYFAGWDTLIFDLAVTINDWCIHLESGELDPARVSALLNAYQQVRPLSTEEQSAWPTMLRGAALRFWLSRLFDFYQPREAHMLTPHDPAHFERILRKRCEQ
ncbi:homoserine kinase [Solimicrobium silvestre]|uniref:Homoserine kinase n=1 Tax=Solimicrobium silvestre TaxID=2099400 RepID=A0A2S9H0Z9_9BURK|nr:homoserine kinase [Solimicrobium silvestre]PRC93662.1 Homoserine kinase [Solimicrobium silvestre]